MKRIIQNTISILTPREKRRLLLLAAADVFISLLDIGALALLLVLINFYTQPGSVAAEWFAGSNVVPALVILASLFIIKNLAAYFIYKAKYSFVYHVATRLSEQSLLQYLEGNYHDYVNKDSAVHIRRISQQPVEFAHYVLAGIQQLISELIMVSLTIIAILIYNATLFLFLCAFLLPAITLLSFYTRRRIRTVRGNIKTSSELALQHLKEALAGYIESNVYDTKDFFVRRYHSKQATLNSYLADLQSVQVLPARLMEIFAVGGLLLLVAFNEYVSAGALIPVVTIGAFVAAAYKIIPGLVRILNSSGQVKTYAFTAEDMLPASARQQGQLQTSHPTIESLSINSLSFDYGEKRVLNNVSMNVQRGEMVGLGGLSGKGKTTLINVLLGFLEPSSGKILINGSVLSARDRQLYWRNTSYVKQQPFLIHDTILKNITLDNKAYDEARLKNATRHAGLDTLLSQLPQGLNTVITENGRNISGGQRQRIALARALYKNADLLLLDEPFAELDEVSEQDLLRLLQDLCRQGKLVILITHNSKSLSYCTKTVSLDAA
ncbi:MAG TPA: ABC transporter ATP-binding protein [Chitinophagaceae bacterium]|nr:ABC transporter ATP-binding protein [Chitinophagaceae bacterium]